MSKTVASSCVRQLAPVFIEKRILSVSILTVGLTNAVPSYMVPKAGAVKVCAASISSHDQRFVPILMSGSVAPVPASAVISIK